MIKAYVLVILSGVLTLILGYPGIVYTDSIVQYQNVLNRNWSDWHPPIMTFLWSVLDKLIAGPSLVLIFQLLLFLVAAFFWLRVFRNSKLIVWGSALLFLTPPIFASNAILWKDVHMVNALFLSLSSYLYVQEIKQNKLKYFLYAISMTSLFYGATVRYNAVAALPPLLCLVFIKDFHQKKVLALTKVIGLSLWIFILGLGVNALMTDEKIYPSQMVKNYDLVGIAYHGGEVEYPLYLKQNERFHAGRVAYMYSPDGMNNLYFSPNAPMAFNAQERDQKNLSELWVRAILNNPIPYLHHRFKVFLSFLRIAPENKYYYAYQFKNTHNPYQWVTKDFALREMIRNVVRFFRDRVFYLPWVWFILSFVTLSFLLIKRKVLRHSPLYEKTLLVNLSGIFFVLCLFPILPAADFRYFLWTYLMTGLSCLMTCEVYLSSKNK